MCEKTQDMNVPVCSASCVNSENQWDEMRKRLLFEVQLAFVTISSFLQVCHNSEVLILIKNMILKSIFCS